MKASIHLFVLITGLLAFSACSSLKVTTDYDKTVDFSSYKTFEYYGWAEDSDKILNQFDKERIEKAFGAEFAKRGWKLVEGNGDAVVSLFIVVDQKTSTTAYTNYYNNGMYGYGPGWGWGSGYGYGGMGGGSATTTYSEQDYLVGTLIVDVWDKASEKLVWQGVGTKTVDNNPNNNEKNIPKAATAIMKDFPAEPMK